MKPQPLYIYGIHAALAALANPMRKVKRVLVTKNAQQEFANELRGAQHLSVIDSRQFESMLPPGSVHQGLAVECAPLDQPSLQEWLSEQGVGSSGDQVIGKKNHPITRSPDHLKPVLLLDQVTDPHNVGAILRSAAAFDVGAVIVTDRNAPAESGVMAKSASGALEMVPLIAVGNLSQAIELLKKASYWIYGLDGEAKDSIVTAKFDAKTALVLGAEGRGLRRLTAENCDFLVKLPMSDKMESLNVSNAAAVALYEVFCKTSGV